MRCRSPAPRRCATLEETDEPALVLVGRPYNLYDRSVNCDIPRKLRDALRRQRAADGCAAAGRRRHLRRQSQHVLEFGAAHSGGGAHDPTTTPTCTWFTFPTSSAVPTPTSSRFWMTPAGKPSLVLQFDGHANDAGFITRCEAYLDSKGFLRCPIGYRHLSRKIGTDHPLAGKTVYIPTMAEGSPEAFAAVFRWLGVDATPTPASDERTRELGAGTPTATNAIPPRSRWAISFASSSSPASIRRKPCSSCRRRKAPAALANTRRFCERFCAKSAMATCRFFRRRSKNGYADLGEISTPFMRAAWRALVAADVLRKALLRTRPYETTPGLDRQGLPARSIDGPVHDDRTQLLRHRVPVASRWWRR